MFRAPTYSPTLHIHPGHLTTCFKCRPQPTLWRDIKIFLPLRNPFTPGGVKQGGINPKKN